MHLLKLSSVLLACALLATPARAAISIHYDNGTGDYSISGADAGPGVVDGTLRYIWDWGNPYVAANVIFVLAPINADEGINGTVDGAGPYGIPPIGFLGLNIAGLEIYETTQTGALALTSHSGTVGTGLWNAEAFGIGNFFGAPYNSTSTELLTLTITNTVPEPSTWAGVVGGLALGFAAWRRRSV